MDILNAPVEGIEPSTRGFGDRRSTTELHRYMLIGDTLPSVLRIKSVGADETTYIQDP